MRPALLRSRNLRLVREQAVSARYSVIGQDRVVEPPAIRLSGPCVEAPDVPALVRFYERFLGWEVEELVGPRDDRPPGGGWGRLRPAERAPGQKIEVQWQEHYQRPVWPGEAGQPTMQWHLDWWVEDLETAVAWATECGAVEASPQPNNRDLSRIRIMLDPAGHPFCLWT
jgi:predicted enzyme related to lactoylglutathione lyase